MEEIKEFTTIDVKFIEGNSVSALATKPNQPSNYGQGGLSATALKKHFDALVREVIGRYNTLAEVFNGTDAASYIKLADSEGGSLRGLLGNIINQDGQLILTEKDDKTIDELITNLQDDIDGIEDDIGEIAEGTTVSALISALQIIIDDISAKNSETNKNYINTSVVVASDKISTPKISTPKVVLGEGVEMDVAVDDSGVKTVQTGVGATFCGDVTITGDFVALPEGKVKSGSVEATNVTATDISATGTIIGQNISVAGNMDIAGNLNVKGDTVIQDHETLLIKDNIIVTNSSGASFSTSGIVICIDQNVQQDGSGNAYGILYDTSTQAVMIGMGIYEEPDEDNSEPKFDFIENQALPLAARDGFDNKGGYFPVWDAVKNAFVPSGNRISEDGNFYVNNDKAATETWVEEFVKKYVADNGGGGGNTAEIAEQLFKINTGGVE